MHAGERKTLSPTSLASHKTICLFSIHHVGITMLCFALFILLFYTA